MMPLCFDSVDCYLKPPFGWGVKSPGEIQIARGSEKLKNGVAQISDEMNPFNAFDQKLI
jgi:hypothetical protein